MKKWLWVSALTTATLAFWITVFLTFKVFNITGSSMAPTIKPGDRIFVSGMPYWLHPVRRGDVVVFRSHGKPGIRDGEYYILRAVAFGGETVQIKFGVFFVNGRKMGPQDGVLNVDYSNPRFAPDAKLASDDNTYSVPDGEIFLLGDNSPSSLDSRYWGAIPEKDVFGKAEYIYLPQSRSGPVR